MNRRSWLKVAYSLMVLTGAAATSFPKAGIAAEPSPPKFALLVGCGEYHYLKGANLRGPKNDVREFSAALQTKFGYAPANIITLVGWAKDDKDAALRPTRTNILKALDQLAEQAKQGGEGTQIVIAFSGHGTRVPIPADQDPLDAKNPELDGLDEAFIAADAQLVKGELENLILDNELGERLQKIRAHGAHVWAVFDCCHSGTLARGVEDTDRGEVSRELTAEQLGVSDEALQQAKAKADAAKAKAPAEAGPAPIFDLQPEVSPRGSLVAFYAAQPFEKAPDLACPATAPKVDSNYFGLLTYTTLQMLQREQPTRRLTYRELGQAINGHYRAERGTRGPTPNFSGDLDREVMGLRAWPGRSSIVLEKTETGLGINAGDLHGVSVGSILAVYPAGASGDEKTPGGYVKVVRSTPASADVESCEYLKTAAVAAEKLKPAMRCEVVSRQLGDLRMSVAIAKVSPELQSLEKLTHEVFQQADDKLGPFVRLTDETEAAWQLRGVTPADAKTDYGLTIEEPQVLLIRRGEFAASNESAKDSPANHAGRVWRQYDPRDAAAFREAVAGDLQKIFTWQNLWRVAGVGQESASIYCDVKVEIDKIKGGKRTPLQAGSELNPGDELELRVSNEGIDRVWVTIVFLDANFRVSVQGTEQLDRAQAAGAALEPLRLQISATTSPGPQACLVIASSAEKNTSQPNYQFLAQKGLGKTPKLEVPKERAGGSPFETLALAVAGQQGTFRGNVASAENNPTLVLRSWVIPRP